MTHQPYRPDYEGRSVGRSDDVAVAGGELVLTCRWPQGAPAKAFVVFCHGLGGNRRAYAELSAILAAHGYLVIHPGFPDAIDAIAAKHPELGLDPQADLTGWPALPAVRERMLEVLHSPFYWMERVRIVRAILDEIDAVVAATCGEAASPLPGAIAGHSFGAYTAQLFAGAQIDVPGEGTRRFAEPRLRAAILLSTQGRDQQGLRKGSWDAMGGPVLTVTGTLDRGAKGQDWHWKCEPFELAPPGGKYLAVLEGAGHYLGGVPFASPVDDHPAQRNAVFELSLAFLDAQLTGETRAQAWLDLIADRIGDCPVLFKRK